MLHLWLPVLHLCASAISNSSLICVRVTSTALLPVFVIPAVPIHCAYACDYSWGGNIYGQLGQDDNRPRGRAASDLGSNLAPVALGTGLKATAVCAASLHTCAIVSDIGGANAGRVKCWGFGPDLGIGTTESRGDGLFREQYTLGTSELSDALPFVDLGVGKVAKAIACADRHTCVVLMDGGLKCFGEGFNGAQLPPESV